MLFWWHMGCVVGLPCWDALLPLWLVAASWKLLWSSGFLLGGSWDSGVVHKIQPEAAILGSGIWYDSARGSAVLSSLVT